MTIKDQDSAKSLTEYCPIMGETPVLSLWHQYDDDEDDEKGDEDGDQTVTVWGWGLHYVTET